VIRSLLLLQVLALLFQFGWASAATYCGHEAQPVEFHAGHHGVTDAPGAGIAAAANGQPDSPAAGADAGHAQCGIGLFGPAAAEPGTAASMAGTGHVFVRTGALRFASHSVHDIERPKWWHAA